MTRSALVAVLMAACAGRPAQAQSTEPAPTATPTPAPEPLRLTLAEAVERARRSSPRLEELRALQEAADAAWRGAKAGRMPQVDLSASYNRRSNVPELTLALPGLEPQTVFPNLPNRYHARAGLTLPLYTGGRVPGQIAAADRARSAAGSDVEAGTNDLVHETVTAYWSLVTAREAERVLAESIASYEAALKQVRDRFAAGVAARNDVLSVQVDRDRAELQRLAARNDADVANANLLRILGLEPGVTVEPAEPLAAPAPQDEGLEVLVAKALGGRPELAGLRARALAAEAEIKVARSATRPQATLGAGYDYARPNSNVLPLAAEWNGTWSVGVSLSLLAFDGGRTAAAAAEARARAVAARQQLQDRERRVRLEVTAQASRLRTRRAALGVAESNLEAARENARVSTSRYREGLIPVADMLDAETRLLRAGLDRATAATDVQQARADLDRAVGR
jgi:outer membrane protein TolC